MTREDRREGYRLAGWSVSAALFYTVLVFVLVVIVGGFMWVWAPWKGQIEARNETVGNGSYRNATYDYYYTTCNAIAASEQKIKTYEDQLKASPPPSSDQQARLQAAIMVQMNVRTDLANQYNGKADAEKTTGQFRADSLPPHIDTTYTIGIETTCS